MPKRTAHRRESRNPLSTFLRRPAVQIGLVAVVALIVVLIAVFGNRSTSSGIASEISVQEAYQLYQQDKTFFLDVREPSEWDEYHAPKTTLIPLGELAGRVNELPKDKQIVVVCRSGNRSQQGRDLLKQAGFTQVTSMAGGLKAWRDQGYPLEP